MLKPLDKTTKFFATTEEEAQNYIESVKEDTHGIVVRQNIARKQNKEFGEYFEVTVTEHYQTSKDVLSEFD